MVKADLRGLLVSPQLDLQQIESLLRPYGFKDIRKADTNLQLMADEPRARQLLSEIIEELTDCFSRSPDPDQSLNFFERFSQASYNKVNLFSYLKASPYTLWLLTKLFGSSPFLSEILIRNPTYLYWISDARVLEEKVKKDDLARELTKTLQALRTKKRKLEVLCLLKRKHLLRIGVQDLLKKSSVEGTTAALSALAEVILQKVYEVCDASLREVYGIPQDRKAAFTILGMGKLGGSELNFSSDVDLLYLYESADGWTSNFKSRDRAVRISPPDYFQRLSQEITTALSGTTKEGYLYRVDLRLRPEGRTGQIAYSLKGYQQYYATRGETWERLALLKAWPVAGDHALGLKFLKRVSRFIYGTPFSPEGLEEVKTIKEKIDRKMTARGESGVNVKLGIGGIREIEFIVQSLQTFFGGKIPEIRERNTLKALKKLLRQKLLPPELYRHLSEAYVFLRNVEHRLQMVHELQTHSLPTDPEELRICALRLDYRDRGDATATDQLLEEHRLHTGRVNRIFRDLFYTPQESLILKAALGRSRHTFSKRSVKKR